MAINISRSSPPLPKTTQAVSRPPISVSRDNSIRHKSASPKSDLKYTSEKPSDLSKYVELKDGTYIDKESFDELPKKFQQIGKTQGYDALSSALSASNRDFKEIQKTHVKLGDDKYISKTDWATIDSKYQEVGLSKGFDAMTEAMKSDWESEHVKLGDDTWVVKSDFEEIPSKYRRVAISKGLEAMNEKIQEDNREAQREYINELREFEDNYIEVGGKYYDRDQWESLTPDQKQEVRKTGTYTIIKETTAEVPDYPLVKPPFGTPEYTEWYYNNPDAPGYVAGNKNKVVVDKTTGTVRVVNRETGSAKITGTVSIPTVETPTWKPDFTRDNPWEGMPEDYSGIKSYVPTPENPLPPWTGEIVGYTSEGADVYNAEGKKVTISTEEEYNEIVKQAQVKAKELSTQIFEQNNIKLADDKYITRDVYNALTPEQKIVADTQGYDALVGSLTQPDNHGN